MVDLLALGGSLAGLPLNSAVSVALFTFLLTALLTGFGVPGVIVPLSITSGALMNAEVAAAVVAAGGALGSHFLFLLTRQSLRNTVRARLGARLGKIEQAFDRGGAWYVLGLRIAGAPSLVLTGACALLPIHQGKFALATFAGFLPTAWLAATVGAAL